MLVNVLTVSLTLLPGLAVPTFGYLKYRAYTKTVREVIDKLGVEGLSCVKAITPPPSPSLRVRRDR